MQNKKLAIMTIVFNGYGEFLDRWINGVEQQETKFDEVVVVLGKDHGFKGTFPDYVKVVEYHKDATMGTLRNLGLNVIKSDYVLYFSADDFLLPCAVNEINKINTDIIALKFLFNNNILHTPKIEENKLQQWRQHYAGICGYYVIKTGLYYDDTDFANFPLLFNAFNKNYTFGITENVCAEYLLRKDSHSNKGNIPFGFKELEKYVKKYFNISG